MKARFSHLFSAVSRLLPVLGLVALCGLGGCVPRDRLNEMSGLPGFDKAAFDVVGTFPTTAYGEAKVRRLKVTGQYDIQMGGSTLPLDALSFLSVSDVQVYPSKTESLIVMQGSTSDCPVAVRAYRFENRLYKVHAIGNCRDAVQVRKAADGTYTLATGTGSRPDDLLWQWAPERTTSRMVGPVTVASQAPQSPAVVTRDPVAPPAQLASLGHEADDIAPPAKTKNSSVKPRRQAREVSDLLLPGAKLGAVPTTKSPRQRLDPNAVAVPETVAVTPATGDTSQPATWDLAKTSGR